MKSHLRVLPIIASAIFLLPSSRAQDSAKHPITFADMMGLHRVAEPQISPDGKWVVYTVATPDMDANRNASNLWLVSTQTGNPIQLTQSGHDSSATWSPDSKMIVFLSSRSGESQVYLLSMDGGEAHPWTTISTGADNVKWSPDGKTIAFTSGVYPDCKDDACNKKRDEEKAKNKVTAHVAEHLLYRHWTHWNDGKRSHLFVVPAPASAEQTESSATPRDLTEGADRL
jgi:dipeptidyl aminopeptidase/acylaminoacyl peptidase